MKVINSKIERYLGMWMVENSIISFSFLGIISLSQALMSFFIISLLIFSLYPYVATKCYSLTVMDNNIIVENKYFLSKFTMIIPHENIVGINLICKDDDSSLRELIMASNKIIIVKMIDKTVEFNVSAVSVEDIYDAFNFMKKYNYPVMLQISE